MKFRKLFIALALLSACVPTQAFWHGSQFNNAFIPLKIGAGGSISGIDIQCDQGVGSCNNSGTTTKVIRTDTYGAYIYNASAPNPGNAGGTGAWQQLMTSASFPVTAGTPYLPDHGFSVYEIKIAPSNTSHLYMMTNGLLYTSTNKGATWVQSALAQTATDGGDQITETFGPYIAIDPKNENIAIVGTANSGAFYTTDGGAHFTQISGLCTPSAPVGTTTGQGGGYLSAFDPSSGGTTSTPGVYLTCYGTGIYHSTTGVSGTFTSVGGTGMPTKFISLDVDSSGVVYVVDNASGNLQGDINKLSGGTWSTVTTGLGVASVAHFVRDPNSTHLFAMNINGSSFFNGTSWGTQQGFTLTATDIPWLQHSIVSNTFAGSKLAFDPAQSNVLFYANGVGVATATPNFASSTSWNSVSAGIEQLVSRGGVTPPNGNPILVFDDRPVFTITNPNRFPTDFGLDYTYPSSRLQSGFSVDYASSSSSFIAVLAQALFDCCGTSGYSTNGGGTDGAPANWTEPFAGFSGISDFVENGGSYHGGSIAAASPTCVVLTVGNGNAAGARAASGLWEWNGTTWSSPTITGIPNTATNPGWGFSHTLVRQILAADRVNPNTVYAYNDGISTSTPGVYKTTNCSTWTKVSNLNLTTSPPTPAGAFTNAAFNATMRAVPGVAGNVFFTSGGQAPDDPLQVFWQSTDGGANWAAVTGVTDVFSFDFGKAKPGESVAAIYCYCRVGGTLGLWRGTNTFSTWTQLATSDGAFLGGSLDLVSVVIGDANTYGRVYICYQGSSCKWGQFS